MKIARCLVFGLTVVLCAPIDVGVAKEPTRNKQELFEYLIVGLKAERERLVSGSFTADGRVVTEGKARGHRESKLEMYYAFDFGKRLLRFDSLETRISGGTTEAPTPQVKRADPLQRGGRLIVTPESRITKGLSQPTKVHIWQPTANEFPAVRPFDVRILGIGDSRSISLNYSLDLLADALREKYAVDDVVEETSNLYRIVLRLGKPGDLRLTLWVDAGTGFSPIRSEFVKRKRHEGEAVVWDTDPYYSSELTWEEHASVWVPRTVVLVHTMTTSSERREFALQWQGVNEPVPDRTFTAYDFGLKKGDKIIDMRGPLPVVLERIGAGEDGGEEATPASPLLWLLVVAATVGAAVLVGVLLWRRRRF